MSEEQSFNHLNLKNQYLTTLIQDFSYRIINDASTIQPKDYIIIDKNDNYFICSYDTNIFFIKINDNYTLAHVNFAKVNSNNIILLKDDIQSEFDCLKNTTIVKDAKFLQIINNFKTNLIVKKYDGDNKDIIDFFGMSIKSIAACLIGNSYFNYSQNRFNNINIFNPIDDSDCISLGIDGFHSSNPVELVYLITANKLCIKKNFNTCNNSDSSMLYYREKNNYANISHPLIPKLIGYNDKANILYIEYVPGQTLYQIVENLTDSQKIKIMFELSAVFMYIHNNNLIYRDLKPNNVILDRNGRVALIDFDRMIPNPKQEDETTTNFEKIYHAPEIQEGYVSYKSDIFSLSKLIYFIFTKEENENEINKKLFKEKIDCDDLINLIEKCSNRNPVERSSISEFIESLYNIFLIKSNNFINKDDSDDIIRYISNLFFEKKGICSELPNDDEEIVKKIVEKAFENGSLFLNNTELKEIKVPDFVKIIGLSTFKNCSSLTELTIHSRVSQIQNYAFHNCTSLKYIQNLSPYISELGASSFSGCSSLVKITIPLSITTIASCAFYGCSKLKEVVIPSSVTTIGQHSFSECSLLNEIIFEAQSSLKYIGKSAFSKCSSLKEIEIPHSVNKIDLEAFECCSNLEQIEIPSSVTSIEDLVFKECSSLKEIIFETPSSVKSIGNSAFFNCSSLERIEIPSSVTSIEDLVFKKCSSLKEIIFETPSSVKSIGNSAFFNCSSLERIEIPSSVRKIGSDVFYGCQKLEKIGSPPILDIIDNHAFNNCILLKEIKIPSSVEFIGHYAFCGCSSLLQLELPLSVCAIGEYAFDDCISLTSIIFDHQSNPIRYGSFSAGFIGKHAFDGCSSLTQLELPYNIYEIGKHAFNGCSSLTQLELPYNINEIREYSFSGCSSLTQIEISSHIYEIGNHAFCGCSSLTQIKIPFSVEIIGAYSFSGCSFLKKVEIPSSVKIIEDYAFSECASMTELSFTIPSSVIRIGNCAFQNCSLHKEVVPSSVREIGKDVFRGCPLDQNSSFLDKLYKNCTIQ